MKIFTPSYSCHSGESRACGRQAVPVADKPESNPPEADQPDNKSGCRIKSGMTAEPSYFKAGSFTVISQLFFLHDYKRSCVLAGPVL